jgi:hypothetical protein
MQSQSLLNPKGAVIHGIPLTPCRFPGNGRQRYGIGMVSAK